MVVDDFYGKRVVVMGLGRFGGGEGVADFLARKGARVLVTDVRGETELAETVARLRRTDGIEFRLGEHREEDFRNADLVVVNPAVADDSHFLKITRSSGALLTTEINLFFELCPALIVGVTGTNGKSTTAALIHSILQTIGLRTYLGGNIGASLLPRLNTINKGDVVVLELSSFQLQRLRWIKRSPQVALLLNLSPNHLDRHKTVKNYAEAKAAILDYQISSDIAVLNATDRYHDFFRERVQGDLGLFAEDINRAERSIKLRAGYSDRDLIVEVRDEMSRMEFSIDIGELGLSTWDRSWTVEEDYVGHNAVNLCAATLTSVATLLKLNIPTNKNSLKDSLLGLRRSFQPLKHRLERVAEIDGVAFVNDSIATNPESVLSALKCYPEKRIVLIAGGYNKKLSYESLAEIIVKRVKKLILIESDGGVEVAKAVREAGGGENFLLFVKSIDEAVRRAADTAETGDTVLLSPACASYGMFANFEERGNRFKRSVLELACARRRGLTREME